MTVIKTLTVDALASAAAAGDSYLLAGGEPQKGYMWEISFPDLTSFGLALKSKMQPYIQSVSIPETSVEPITDYFMGEKFTYPGKDASPKQITVTFWDDQNLTVYLYLQNWMNLIHNDAAMTGRQISAGTTNSYFRDMKLQLKDMTDFIVNLEITFKEAFIVSIQDISLTYDSSDPLRITATFAYNAKIIGTPVSDKAESDVLQIAYNQIGLA